MTKPLCLFMAGASNSGKTHILKNYRIYHNCTMINPDLHFEYYSNKFKLPLNLENLTSEQYSISNKILSKSIKYSEENFIKAVGRKDDIILDTTSASIVNLQKKYKLVIDNNYTCLFIFVYADPSTLLKRNSERSRKLRKEIVLRTWINTISNLEEYIKLFKNSFHFIKTDDVDIFDPDALEDPLMFFTPEARDEIIQDLINASRNRKLNYFLRLKPRTPNYIFRELRKKFKVREKYTPPKNYKAKFKIPKYEEYKPILEIKTT